MISFTDEDRAALKKSRVDPREKKVTAGAAFSLTRPSRPPYSLPSLWVLIILKGGKP